MSDMVDRRTLLKGGSGGCFRQFGPLSPTLRERESRRKRCEFHRTSSPFSAVMAGCPHQNDSRCFYGPCGWPASCASVSGAKINYEEWGKITFRTDHALFADGPGRFPIEFFHLGLFFQKAVDLHVVEGGQSRKIIYDQAYFDMPADSVARQMPEGAGFAGFRIQEARDGALDWHKNDWVAFLGAAYFRSIGEPQCVYGLSARGIALSMATSRIDRSSRTEFPRFHHSSC